MIQLQSADQLKRATERARAGKLFVQATAMFRHYRVTNRENRNAYIVNFFVRAGKRFGYCTCLAGVVNNTACKHLSVAAGLHMIRRAARRVRGDG